MLRITIEIENDEASVMTSLGESGVLAAPAVTGTALSGAGGWTWGRGEPTLVDTGTTQGAMAASGAQDAGAAPVGLDSVANAMNEAMPQAMDQGAPLPFVGSTPESSVTPGSPTDLAAGPAPDAELEPAPFIMTEANAQ